MSRQRVDDPGLQAEKEVALGFDLQRLEPEFLEDPYPTYHRLRRWDPVHRCPDGSYFLTRYDDVASVYRDHARLSSDKKVELEPVPGPDRLVRGNRAVEEFKAFLRVLCEDRRRHPLNDDGEVLSKLITAEDEQGALSEVELLHQCIFLLNAGHETTTNLIGNGVHALLEHPGELRRLQDDSTLIETAIEEFLRYESSNQLGNRRALVDVEIGVVALSAGTLITLGIGAANRDPAQFPDPDRLDIGRTPNRHLAFITGIHACAGMWLARMEGRAAIGQLVARFPNLRAAGPPVRAHRARFRVVSSFPLTGGRA